MSKVNFEIIEGFIEAVFSAELDRMAQLLKEHEFLRLNQHEDNSLFQMCLRNHEREQVKIFIAEDSSLAIKAGYSQAHQYAENGELTKLTDILKAQRDLLQATDSHGNTPLHLAATQGNLEVVQFLHAEGANLSALNADKNTPLQLALLFEQNNQKGVAKFLINQTCADKDLSLHFSLDSSDISGNNLLTPQYGDLKLITQESWDQLFAKAYENKNYYSKTNILDLLIENGYLPLLQEINLVGQMYKADNLDFTGINFEGCKFNGIFSNVKFGAGKIENTEFDHAYFNKAEFGSHADFSHTTFADSYFQNTKFAQNAFHDVLFSHTHFEKCTSVLANFDTVFVSHSNLLGLNVSYPHAQSMNVVMDNTVFNLETIQGSANNIQFLNQHAPVIGLICGPDEIVEQGEVGMTANAPYGRLNQYGATTVLLNTDGISTEINTHQLGVEIQSILASVPEGMNIPKYVLSQHAENLDKIKASAHDYAKHLDAAWIPGGADIHPEFYGKTNTESHPDSDYTREIFEFALIDHMVTNNKPLMGICHGSQITNVYFGGTLKQDVDGHDALHLVMPLKGSKSGQEGVGVVSEVLNEPTLGVSAHHQSIDKLGEGLEPVAVSGPAIKLDLTTPDYTHNIQTVIEASEGTNGKPVMLFQFHPEYNLDNTNANIVKQFVNLAAESKQAHALAEKVALNLNDILTSNPTLDLGLEVTGHPQLADAPAMPIYIPELTCPLLGNQTESFML